MKKHTIALTLALSLPVLAQDAAKDKLMEAGKATYMTCMACHGMDGQGMAVGPGKMAPSFTKSEIATGDPAIFALTILKGIAKEDQKFMGMMTPMEGTVPTDESLAGIMTYIRNSFDNNASVVTVEQAKAFREQWKDIKAPVTRAKLIELEKAAKK